MEFRNLENSPNDDCLREMAKHILYEIDGFRKGFRRWYELCCQSQPSDPELLNRTIETALLHYRTMLEFFRSQPVQITIDGNLSTDVVATDYVVPLAAEVLKEKGKQLCEEYKARIDQQLCHISTGRREGTSWKQWPTGRMATAMEELISDFQRNLPAERTGWFTVRISDPAGLAQGQVSNGTQTVEVKPFPMPFSASSASRR